MTKVLVSNVKGPKGDKGDPGVKGDPGETGLPGPNTVPTAQFMADQAADPASAFSLELTAKVLEVAEPLSAHAFGAKGDGVADDTAALQALLTYSPTAPRTRFIPAGTYLITAGLTLSPTLNLVFEPGAIIKAAVAIAGPMIQTVVGTRMDNRFIEGGVLDCNNLADNGLYVRNFANLRVAGTRVHNAKGDAFLFNDPAVASTSYELHAEGLNVTRDPSGAVPASSIGIVVRSTDSTVDRCVVQGQDWGIRNEQSSNRFSKCHVWGYNGKLPTGCFYDTGWSTIWAECVADTPSTYGWYVTGRYTQYIANRVFINGYGIDNAVTGVWTTDAAPAMNVVGFLFQGIDATHRLLRDFGGPNGGLGGNYTLLGLTLLNVVNQTAPIEDTVARIRLNTSLTIHSSAAASFALRDPSGVTEYVVMDANATPKRLQFKNGIPVSGYADGGPTETFRLSASSGAIRSGTPAGVGAAEYSGSGAPDGALGSQGDRYWRSDTPTTANQRLYYKTGATTWVGIL